VYAWGNARHGKLGLGSSESENILQPTQLELMKGKKAMQAACGNNFSILLAMVDRLDDKDEGALINLKDVLIRSAEKAKRKITKKRGMHVVVVASQSAGIPDLVPGGALVRFTLQWFLTLTLFLLVPALHCLSH
jgi:predicted ABC-type transport system involved in lysophospholipase L1 biosynthesis ATPase subunit